MDGNSQLVGRTVGSRPVIFGLDTQQLGLDVDELVELTSLLSEWMPSSRLLALKQEIF
jgi:hypothetical protein